MTKTQKAIILLATAVFMPAAWLYSQAQELDSPYMSKELSELMSSLTFRVTFDSESMEPDMALGEKSTPKIHASYDISEHPELEYDEGILGKGLALGSGVAVYPAEGNITLKTCGAIAFWIKPLEWKRPNGENSTFFMLRSQCFYIQRQGPKVEGDKVRRNEHVMCAVKKERKQKRFSCIMTASKWQNGEWYFVAVNWEWPTFSMSINGEPFMTKSLASEPAEEFFSDFTIGARGGDKGVIDEVLMFNRPLSEEGVNSIYKTVLNWKKQEI